MDKVIESQKMIEVIKLDQRKVVILLNGCLFMGSDLNGSYDLIFKQFKQSACEYAQANDIMDRVIDLTIPEHTRGVNMRFLTTYLNSPEFTFDGIGVVLNLANVIQSPYFELLRGLERAYHLDIDGKPAFYELFFNDLCNELWEQKTTSTIRFEPNGDDGRWIFFLDDLLEAVKINETTWSVPERGKYYSSVCCFELIFR